MPTVIKRSTKKNIFDHFNMEQINFCGRMNDKEFLERLYDLKKLPSNDSRYEDAAGDIWQHTVNNYDLQGNWVFEDGRFELLDGSDETFLKFIGEMAHPLVRVDPNEAKRIIQLANDWLQEDGWQLYAAREIAGGKIYDFRQVNGIQTLQEVGATDVWDKGNYRLFLSHSSTIRAELAIIKRELAMYGVAAFLAHDDIEPTAEWQEEIIKALKSMDSLAAFITPEFNASVWCQQEIGFALGRGVPIVSVKIGDIPAGFAGRYQALRANWNEMTFEIMKALLKKPGFIDIYLTSLAAIKNYTEGNCFAKLLEHIPNFDESLAIKLINLYNETGQIQGSHGFSGFGNRIHGPGLQNFLKAKGFPVKVVRGKLKLQ